MENNFVNEVDRIYESIHQQCLKSQDIWKNEILFTWRWWLLVILTILFWGIWILVRKKESTDRLLYAGLFMSLISSHLDLIGVSLGLWTYPINIILPVPPFLPWDFCFLPVATMLFIQLKPKISPLIKSVIFAFISSFIVEPAATYGDFYHPVNWKYCYSFPVFILLYLASNYLYTRNNFAK